MRTARQEFSKKTCEEAWERCKGRCEGPCRQRFDGRVPEYDHRIPAAEGGDNTLENCQVLCARCHRIKTKAQASSISHTKAIIEKRAGLRRSRTSWGNSQFRKKMSGEVVRR